MIPAIVVVSFFIWQSTAGTGGAVWCAAFRRPRFRSSVTASGSSPVCTCGRTLSARRSRDRNRPRLWARDQPRPALGLEPGRSDSRVRRTAAALVAIRAGTRSRWCRPLALSVVLVPVYQALSGHFFSMDKHLSAGSGLARARVGYGVSQSRPERANRPGRRRGRGRGALPFPAVTGIWYSRRPSMTGRPDAADRGEPRVQTRRAPVLA